MLDANYQTKRLTEDELIKCWQSLPQNFTGCFRMSNAAVPVFLNNEPLPALCHTNESFLFEALLYAEGQLSISIRQFNDFWVWNQVEWKGLPPEQSTEQDDFLIYTQLTKAPEGFRGMKFYTQYLPANSSGFSVLQPAWNAFIGFEKGE